MGACQSEEVLAKKDSKELDQKLSSLEAAQRFEDEAIITGMPNSGVTTFLRQIHTIHAKPYSDDERRPFLPKIRQRIIQLIRKLSQESLKYGEIIK